MQSQKTIIQCKGLATNPNPLTVGDGWMTELDNMVLVRPDLAESRRGRIYAATLGGKHEKLFAYDNALVAHYAATYLAKTTGGAYSAAIKDPAGADASISAWNYCRLQGCVASNNLYLAGSARLMKLAGSGGVLEAAGAVRALSFDRKRITQTSTAISRTTNVVTVTMGAAHGYRAGHYIWKTTSTAAFPSGLKRITSVTSTTFTYNETAANAAEVAHAFDLPELGESAGWLADGFQAAYRYVLFRRDAKKNLLESTASGRLVVTNSAVAVGYIGAAARNTVVQCLLPSDVTTDYYVQLYRSTQVAVGTNPSDDLQLVYEGPITTEDVTSRCAQIRDITPDGLKGAFIYTAPTARANGAISANKERPPAVLDVALFRNRLFGANIVGRQRFVLSILAVGGTEGIQNGDVLYVGSAPFTARTAGAFATNVNEFLLEVGGTAAQNNENTALNLVAAINRTLTTHHARYISSQEDFVAKVEITTADPSGSTFSVRVDGGGSKRLCYSPVLGTELFAFRGVAVRAGTTVTVTAANAFIAGENIVVNGYGALSSGTFRVTSATAAAFTYEDPVSGAVAATDIDATTVAQATSAGDVVTNRVVWSNFGEMEAFPLANYLDVGPADALILGIEATDDQLVVFTDKGTYRVIPSGDGFEAEIVDRTLLLHGPDTLAVMNGTVIGWTNRGVVGVSGLQVEKLSRDIDDKLIASFAARGVTSLRRDSFAVGYEPDQQYLLWLPNAATYPTCPEAYVLHLDGSRPAWTRWTFPTNPSCGVYNPTDGLWYYGGREGGLSDSYLFKERKTYDTTTDFRDHLNAVPDSQSISRKLTWIVQTDAPGRVKHWQEVALLMNAGPYQVTIEFIDKYGTSAGNDSFASAAGPEARTYVRRGAARGTRLTVIVTNSAVDKDFTIQGLALSFEVLGNEVTK